MEIVHHRKNFAKSKAGDENQIFTLNNAFLKKKEGAMRVARALIQGLSGNAGMSTFVRCTLRLPPCDM